MQLAQLLYVFLWGAASSVRALSCNVDSFAEILADNENVTINYARTVEDGGTFGIPSPAFPFNATNLPALCVVGVNVKSSSNSSFNFGLFLPDQWNERFMGTGNGGFGGGINWPDMGQFVQYGFASMSTDTGHLSSPGDGSWGFQAPESLIDWGHRAMHGSVALAKEIVNTYYAISDGIKFSYYASCSTGGRQGLKEAQMYPEDFDGMSVGAPAWFSTHLSSATLWAGLYNQPEDSPKHIDVSQFPAVVAEIERQCDPQDGVTDGIISDPYGCNFDFGALLCDPSKNQSSCLTAPQLETIDKFYSDWVDVNQTFVFPGAALGTDPTLLMATVQTLGIDYFKFWVHNDTNFDPMQFTFKDVQFADTVDPGDATADDFAMDAYRSRGGKILMYHGGADSLIQTGSSVLFYDQVFRTVVPQGITPDDYFRFFLVPGMNHCGGSTVAPWYIAGSGQTVGGATHSVPGFEDPEHDVILALMRWVEDGVAPDQLIATKFTNDNATQGFNSQRPLCVHPKQAKYSGSGDINLAENWECRSL